MTLSAPDTSPEFDPDTLWSRVELLPSGSYAVGCSLGPDRAWTLPSRTAERHAVDAIALATAAEHDAAVVRMLTGAGLSLREAGSVLTGVRARRDGFSPCRNGPLLFEAGCRSDGKPFIDLKLDGTKIGQFTPNDLRSYATGLLGTMAAVQLDTTFYRVLTHTLEMDSDGSRAFVGMLAKHWPKDGDRPSPEPTGATS